MTASYLVQTRGHGEVWSTKGGLNSLVLAAKVADRYAAERNIYGDGCTGPVHAYVRVSLRGRCVYDPRDPVSVVAPDLSCPHDTTQGAPGPLPTGCPQAR